MEPRMWKSWYPWDTYVGDQLWQCGGLFSFGRRSFLSSPLVFVTSAMGADESFESKRHSCGTLADGIEYMDLSLQEQHLQRQLQAAIALQNCQLDTKSYFNKWFCNQYTGIPSESRQDLEDQLQDDLDGGVSGASCESIVVRIRVFIIHYLNSSSPDTITSNFGFTLLLLRPHLQRPSAPWTPYPPGPLESFQFIPEC